MVNEDLLQLAEGGDLAALVELDCQGLLLGAEPLSVGFYPRGA